MNFQIFNEVRKSKYEKYAIERCDAMINMDAVAVVTTEEYMNVDCFQFFMTGGWSLYVEANDDAKRTVQELLDGDADVPEK